MIIDLTPAVQAKKFGQIIDALTISSIQAQNAYARAEGKPDWTDEQIGRVYGYATLEKWKQYREIKHD